MNELNFNLQNQAYNQITGKILRNEYRPGQKISQKNIEIDLQLGRTPVREHFFVYVVMDSFTASLNQEPSSQKLI